MLKIIVLAAGMSRRMGVSNKLLLPFGSSTILETTVENIIAANIGEVFVVVGHEADVVKSTLENLKTRIALELTTHNPRLKTQTPPLSIIENFAFKNGMTTSIQTGIRAAQLTTQNSHLTTHFMVCLADMPWITVAEYRLLANAFATQYVDNQRVIVQPTFGGRRGNPTVFSNIYSNIIRDLKNTEGAKSIIEENLQELCLVEMPTNSVLRDVDSPSDYEKLTD